MTSIAVRKNAPAWAKLNVIEPAARHCDVFDAHVMIISANSLVSAVTGAMMMAQALYRHHAPCENDDCDCCSKIDPRQVPDEVRKAAHAILDYYLEARILVMAPHKGEG